jgi:hypothetical protein
MNTNDEDNNIFTKVFSNAKITKKIYNYLTKEDLLNLALSSKTLNTTINKGNHLLLEIISCSRAP